MNIEQTIQLVVLFLLLVFSASFSSVEAALFSLSRIDLKAMKKSGSLIGKQILTVLSDPRDLLTTILFGNEFINVGIAILAGSLAYSLMEGQSWTLIYLVSVGASTLFILIFGEIIPKTLALRNAVSVSYLFIGPLQLFAWLTFPFRYVLTWLINRLLLLLGGDPEKTHRMIMEEEFMQLVDIGHEAGTIEEIERTFIENIFEFDDRQVKEIMTPRGDIIALDDKVTAEEVLRFTQSKKFSRIPIYKDTLDQIEGVLFTKDLIIFKMGQPLNSKINHLLREPYFISPKIVLSEALEAFKKRRVHIALVRERNKIVGLVTMDDLLRELST